MNCIYLSGEYSANNPGWHQEHSHWKSLQVRKMLAKHGLVPQRIAEVGCGTGDVLEDLYHKLDPQPYCLGFEISSYAYALAQKREAPGLKFVLGKPPHDLQLFDALLAMDVFEHVDDYLGFIRDLKNLATWKIFHIPLDLSTISLLRPSYLKNARDITGHLHYFTRDTALASLEYAGLSIIDWFYTSVELDTTPYGKKKLHLIRKFLFSRNPDLCAHLLGGLSILVLAQ